MQLIVETADGREISFPVQDGWQVELRSRHGIEGAFAVTGVTRFLFDRDGYLGRDVPAATAPAAGDEPLPDVVVVHAGQDQHSERGQFFDPANQNEPMSGWTSLVP